MEGKKRKRCIHACLACAWLSCMEDLHLKALFRAPLPLGLFCKMQNLSHPHWGLVQIYKGQFKHHSLICCHFKDRCPLSTFNSDPTFYNPKRHWSKLAETFHCYFLWNVECEVSSVKIKYFTSGIFQPMRLATWELQNRKREWFPQVVLNISPIVCMNPNTHPSLYKSVVDIFFGLPTTPK